MITNALVALTVACAAQPLPVRDTDDYADRVRVSEHFALKWGDEATLDTKVTEPTLAALERALARYDALGFRRPPELATHAFNVYVADTGSPSPAALGASGWFGTNEAGSGFLVVAHDVIVGDPAWRDFVVSHELFHAVQHAYDDNPFADDLDAWFVEASAEWAATQIAQGDGNDARAQFVGAYLLLPEISIGAFGSFDDIDLFHPYGAFLWLQFLSEHLDDPSIIQIAWENPARHDDPLDAIEDALARRGHAPIDQQLIDHAIANVLGDYEDQAHYDDSVEVFLGAFGIDHRIADVATPNELIEAPPELSPQRAAYNVVRLEQPIDGAWTIDFVPADDRGRWRTALIVHPEERVVHFAETIDVDVTGASSIDLVAAQTVIDAEPDARFGYQYRFTAQPPADVVAPDAAPQESAASCASTQGTGIWIVALIGVASVRRRCRRLCGEPGEHEAARSL